MPKLTDLKSRVIRSLQGRSRLPAAPKEPPAGDGRTKRVMSCQSLCLQCDARTPCTLGRLIG
jgi:hypothetical protein